MNNMKNYNNIHFIFIIAALVLNFIVSLPVTATEKRPMVAISPIKSLNSTYSYVGPAITQMLITRLSSEGIDTFLIQDTKKQTEAIQLSDFLITGVIKKSSKTFDAEISLKEPKNGDILKKWPMKAISLDALAQDIALFSAKLSDTIKHAEDILVTHASDTALSSEAESNDEFVQARIHPDKLIRERLEKDKEKELEQQARQEAIIKQQEKIALKTRKEVPEQWEDPLPDVYDPDADEEPAPVEIPQVTETKIVTQAPEKQSSSKNWYSMLWPFGKKKDLDKTKKWEKEREKLNAKKKSKKKIPQLIAKNQLPYPPPPEIKLDIPAPVPLDQALKKIDQIKVKNIEIQKDKSWYSMLWPWSQNNSYERETYKVSKTAHANSSQNIQARANTFAVKEGLKEIEQIRSQSSTTEGNMESGSSKPEHFDGPIWQWY